MRKFACLSCLLINTRDLSYFIIINKTNDRFWCLYRLNMPANLRPVSWQLSAVTLSVVTTQRYDYRIIILPYATFLNDFCIKLRGNILNRHRWNYQRSNTLSPGVDPVPYGLGIKAIGTFIWPSSFRFRWTRLRLVNRDAELRWARLMGRLR